MIDNPPFSILAEIKRFYLDRGIPFFLFAPALILLSTDSKRLTSIVANCPVTYHNGAVVRISYVSNLFGDTALILAPELARMVKEAQQAVKASNAQPRYEYPPNVVTGAALNKYIVRGVSLRVLREEIHFTRTLDSMRKVGKGLCGSGFIVSDQVTKILQSAPKELPTYWELSDREQEVI